MAARTRWAMNERVPMLRAAVGRALPAQIIWTVLAALWNFAGVALIEAGQRPLGPTATLAGGVTLLVIGLGLVLSVSRWPLAYLLLTIVAAAFGIYAVINAITADPALWPSEFWRVAGAVLNGFGGLAGLAAVVAWVRWAWQPQAPGV